MSTRRLILAAATAFSLTLPVIVQAQVATNVPAPVPGAKAVTLKWLKVHSPAIAGNLEGDSPDRDVLVVLPPSYATSPARRYSVIYALHGYSIGAAQWIKEIHVPQTVEGAFAKGAREMIVVFPDSKTVHNGSMYSSSVTTGDFETFISRDLVRYVDSHFRTLANRESRGLVGHSMGGYGATRIGLKHADVFGALYIMSPCCLAPRDPKQFDVKTEAALAGVHSLADATKLDWGERAQLATAAAWSPDPKNPPLFLELPMKDGVIQPDVLAKWAANAPLAFIDQYAEKLRSYRAISIDVGDKDGLKDDTQRLHDALDKYGIANAFEIYHGTHTSDVAFRVQDHVIPFFSRYLLFPHAR
jgi:enterochelin esterase-like enzyme